MRIRTTLASTGLTAVMLACCTATTDAANAQPTTADLVTAVELRAVQGHLRQLQKIADANGGNRESLSAGAEKTAEYIAAQLRESGYEPVLQHFPYMRLEEQSPPVLEQTAPEARQYRQGKDFASLPLEGSGDVTASVTTVRPGSADCQDDWTGFRKGTIALVKVENGCDPAQQAQDAAAAGAAAVVVHRGGISAVPKRSTPDDDTETPEIDIPVLVVSPQAASEFTASAGEGTLKLRVKVDQKWFRRGTGVNVIADTKRGSADSIVMVGAHLDSVPQGPGINDNGTGTAAVLVIAQRLPKLGKQIKNRVRFAWWGAEELNLVGSAFYVKSLDEAERRKIALYLNFDMVGSPNGVRFVFDGDDSLGEGTDPPKGSEQIEKVLTGYFARRGLQTTPMRIHGGSDHRSFAAAGIPVGGMETGTDELKTQEQAAIYGGDAGEPYDACYHKRCDDLRNINAGLLDQMADGAAYAVRHFASTTPALHPWSPVAGRG
ncbi:M28 family peptidase [Streptosporangium sp. CA-135522]|uniref:M28 family peptidase n=1 Tax=Streptosporangium sp. CA-135522 TaxID=3240072 RepID=UPI003D8C5565